jgi:hypothetical protein
VKIAFKVIGWACAWLLLGMLISGMVYAPGSSPQEATVTAEFGYFLATCLIGLCLSFTYGGDDDSE